ncbi:site-specific recombinase XerD [Actinokineospora spheciospongiae]|nr:site-specific recombinase XerD [Actinokineospora spheciospongiae]
MARRQRSNGEGSVYQRADGLWIGAAFVLTTSGHRRRVVVSATTSELAWERLRKKIASSDAGIPVAAENWTVGEFLRYWLSTVDGELQPRTVEGYRVVVNRHLIPNLGSKKLDRLSASDVRTFMTKLRNRCRCCADNLDGKRPKSQRKCCSIGKCCEQFPSKRTVQQVHAVLRNALQQAMREELIARNVAKLIKVSVPKYDVNRGLTFEQAKALLKAAEGDRLEALYVLAVFMGLRRGELLGLRWSDIDWDGWEHPCAEHRDEFCEDCAERYSPTLRVRNTLQRVGSELVFLAPKTESSKRVSPLIAVCREALVEHWDRQDDEREAAEHWQDLDLVFATPTGGPLDPSNLRSQWHPMRQRAGLGDVRFHDLRHSCVTLLLKLGVPPHIVRDIVGHSDIHVTMTIYASVTLDDKREALRRLSDEMGR